MAGEIELHQQTLETLLKLETAIRETWPLRRKFPSLRAVLRLAFINRRHLKRFLANLDTKGTDGTFKP